MNSKTQFWTLCAAIVISLALDTVILIKVSQTVTLPEITVNEDKIEQSKNRQDSIRAQGDKDIARADSIPIDSLIDILTRYRGHSSGQD